MAKSGFRRNAGAIAAILHNDPGGQAAVIAAAEQVAEQIPDAKIDYYHTDRFVAGVVVPAHVQAKDGAATRAAAAVGLTPG